MIKSAILNRFSYTKWLTFFVGFALLLALGNFVISQLKINKQNEQMQVTYNYNHFDNHIQTFLMNNSHLMKGFAAYIQSFEYYDEKDIYKYLSHLVDEDIYYIRNIGIIKDSTIVWNFPKKENMKSIGTDLSKIPEQAESIQRIKKTLKYDFDGPVNLIQGGTGYIMRVPILKSGRYWGLASIVLKADKVTELFDSYANECKLSIAIFSKTKANTLVYGNRSILEQKPMAYQSSFAGANWTIYAVSSGSTGDNDTAFVWMIAVLGALLILWVSGQIYRLLRSTERIKNENDSLNAAVMNDALTGINNRKYFDIRIAEETERANRYNSSLGIVFFDLDHFKAVNDTYGHGFGDIVLKEVAAAVKKELRSSDVFARWGGEEFVILMPETTLLSAAATAEKLRKVVEAIDHNTVGRVAASFGVAEYILEEFIGSFFHRVDDALYAAKSNGRNQVAVAEGRREQATVLVKTVWTNEWLCGNEIIDMDHKRILVLGNEMIESAYHLSNKNELLECVAHFADHVVQHFQNEESILKSIGYPGLHAHAEVHQVLTNKMASLMEKVYDNSVTVQELFAFLQNDVLLGHMNRVDIEFYPYFQKEQIK